MSLLTPQIQVMDFVLLALQCSHKELISMSTVIVVDSYCVYHRRAESQRKRRAGDRSGAKKRGRPRKPEPIPEISVIQEEAAAPEEAPAVAVVSEASEIIPDQTFVSLSLLPAVESQPAAVAAPLPLFGSLQSPVFTSTLAPPASVNPTDTPLSLSVFSQASTKNLDTPPVRVQDLAPTPASDAAPAPTPVLAASTAAAPPPPAAPSEVGALYIESEDRKDPNQVTIEDLGPDEEEDISLSQEKGEGEGKKMEI